MIHLPNECKGLRRTKSIIPHKLKNPEEEVMQGEVVHFAPLAWLSIAFRTAIH